MLGGRQRGQKNMKTTSKILLALALISAFSFQFSAFGQGTALTYQGRLNDGTNPANGSYDLRFGLYNAASGGAQQGNAITNSPTGITNGLFTVTLDFGNQFTGADRWLEIGVHQWRRRFHHPGSTPTN